MKSLRPLILLTCVVIFASLSVAAAYHMLTPARAGTGDSWSRSAMDALPASVPPIGTPAAGHVRFAVIGDFGAGGQDEADVAAQVKSWTPGFDVTVGDNRYNNRYGSNYDTVVGTAAHHSNAASASHSPGRPDTDTSRHVVPS